VPREPWHQLDSSAVARYRHADGVLELVFVDADMSYDYPCSDFLLAEFLAAPSKGRFVNGVLKPHAEALGWTPTPHELDR